MQVIHCAYYVVENMVKRRASSHGQTGLVCMETTFVAADEIKQLCLCIYSENYCQLSDMAWINSVHITVLL